MPRGIHLLSALSVSRKRRRGFFGDGGGLYLQVSKWGTKSWVFRYRWHGVKHDLGLGSLNTVDLARARGKALKLRVMLDDGLDPLAARQAERAQGNIAMTFDACSTAYIDAHKAGWRNAKHAEQWTNTLTTYASPVFGALPVGAIDTALVMKVLDPLWQTKTETATRLRGRIESVLSWATVRGYRTGENPARWRGHLDKLLPRRSKVRAVRHHAALPYAQLPAFMRELRAREGVSARALETIILTAARVSEAVNAKWSEFDLEARVWTVPSSRMKAAREHRVPLTKETITVLKAMADQRQSDFVFPGWKVKSPLTGAACLELLKEMGRSDLTTHGFRSTFRDWAAEQTAFPREIAEAALAHTLKDKTEAAYQRGDLLERRRKLMEAWAAYCGKTESAVIPINASKSRAKRSA